MLTTNRRGLIVKAKVGRVVTPEMVKDLAEDEQELEFVKLSEVPRA